MVLDTDAALPDQPFDAVRRSCAWVAEHAELVEIDHARLASYAGELAAAPPGAIDDPARRRHGDADTTARYVLALGAVNFGSGWFPALRKPSGVPGYFVVARGLEAALPLTADWLAAVDAATVAHLLGQEPDGVADPFFAELAGALGDLGRLLRADHDGSGLTLVAAAEQSAARLAGLLWAMPRYHDRAEYRGRPVWFLKRAQITALDLSYALAGHRLGTFHDLAHLTVLADNLLPHVLRTEGVLVYRSGLADLVDSRRELVAASAPEVELRAATVHAGELLAAAITRRRGRLVTPAQLDGWLWTRGQHERYRQAPRHRTRTVYY